MTRLGSINFINSLPVDWGILSGAVPCDAKVLRGTPARLNEQIASGDLDLSPVSTLHYAEAADDYVLLPELSISSRSGVGSVLLLSLVPVERLQGKRVALSPQGKTTPALLEILLAERWQIACDLEAAVAPLLEGSGFSARLVIGDEALTALEEAKGLHVYDLAQEWAQWTGLPFVFAVWVARRAFYEKHPDRVEMIRSDLEASRAWGRKHPEEITREARARTGLGLDAVKKYFGKLDYGFDLSLRRGMERFIELAREREGTLRAAG